MILYINIPDIRTVLHCTRHRELERELHFTSERFGFRNEIKDDLYDFAEMNLDKDVKEHFPNLPILKETAECIRTV